MYSDPRIHRNLLQEVHQGLDIVRSPVVEGEYVHDILC